MSRFAIIAVAMSVTALHSANVQAQTGTAVGVPVSKFETETALHSYVDAQSKARASWLAAEEARQRKVARGRAGKKACNLPDTVSRISERKRWGGARSGREKLLIKGVMVDNEGVALTGGNVVIPGSLGGVNTGLDGSFRFFMDVVNRNGRTPIVGRRIGYVRAEDSVDVAADSIEVEVRLCADFVQLIGQIVVGQGGESRRESLFTDIADKSSPATVKQSGEYLVILSDSVLQTARIRNRKLVAVHSVAIRPAYAKKIALSYDGILVSGNRVIVLGERYMQGTDIVVFTVSDAGLLQRESINELTHGFLFDSNLGHARIVGGQLVLFGMSEISSESRDPDAWLPRLRGTRSAADTVSPFRVLASHGDVFHAAAPIDPSIPAVVHSVTRCSFTTPRLRCRSTALLGRHGSVVHVSKNAVYLSEMEGPEGNWERSTLLRMPLDGSVPEMFSVTGRVASDAPVSETDSKSFSVLLSQSATSAELLRISRVTPARIAVRAERLLEIGKRSMLAMDTWLAGDVLAVLSGEGADGVLSLRSLTTGVEKSVALRHPVTNLLLIGNDIGAIGRNKSLNFTLISRPGGTASTRHYQVEGDPRSDIDNRGFVYSDELKLIGIPIRDAKEPYNGSSAVKFVAVSQSGLSPVGTIGLGDSSASDSDLENSRPVFIGDRIFVILGQTVVEAKYRNGQLREITRVKLKPVFH